MAVADSFAPMVESRGGFGGVATFVAKAGRICGNWSGVKRKTTSVKSSSAVGPPGAALKFAGRWR